MKTLKICDIVWGVKKGAFGTKDKNPSLSIQGLTFWNSSLKDKFKNIIFYLMW